MAISNSQNYSKNRNEVINLALFYAGVVGEDQTASTVSVSTAADLLNMMIKAWGQHTGIHIWSYGEGAVVLKENIVSHTLNTSSNTKVCKAGGFIKAEIGAAEAAAQTTLTVDSSTNMAASDVIFIELDDGTTDETTISSVSDATTIIIASGLTSAAALGNHIYVYTPTTDDLPVLDKITQVRLRDSGANERVLQELTRPEYFSIHDKTASGSPMSFYVNYERTDPVLFIWPQPSSRKEEIRFTYQKRLDDMDASTDDFEFPVEWLDALTYNLAYRLAMIYNRYEKAAWLKEMAGNTLEQARNGFVEEKNIPILPKGQ